MNCPQCQICSSSTTFAFSHLVLGKYNVSYFLCSECDLLQTEKPYWLKESYASPINLSDTGYVYRNINFSKKVLSLFVLLFGKNKKYLDYGGGYGVFTRLMRDLGLDYYWMDPLTKNVFAQGFEYTPAHGKIEAQTCFECFEHFAEPMKEIDKMIGITENILFSTDLRPVGHVPDASWHYYGFNHGQHLALYSTKTLRFIAQKKHLYFYTNNRNLHLFTKKPHNRLWVKFLMLSNKIFLNKIIGLFLKSKTDTDSQTIIQSHL